MVKSSVMNLKNVSYYICDYLYNYVHVIQVELQLVFPLDSNGFPCSVRRVGGASVGLYEGG